ncbi:L-cystatin [Tachypleus tridentatus]|uniref:L-cystatin n=1 Tax=Tachypleus tridentatus TaxID=6853 RepID=UPI003FD6ADA4
MFWKINGMETHDLLRCAVVLALVGVSIGQMPGGWENADVDNNDVKKAANFATKQLNSRFDDVHHHKLVKIYEAQKQVVSGMKYKVLIEIAATTCKKSEVSLNEVEDCDVDISGVRKLCNVVVWVQVWIPRAELTEFHCLEKPQLSE